MGLCNDWLLHFHFWRILCLICHFSGRPCVWQKHWEKQPLVISQRITARKSILRNESLEILSSFYPHSLPVFIIIKYIIHLNMFRMYHCLINSTGPLFHLILPPSYYLCWWLLHCSLRLYLILNEQLRCVQSFFNAIFMNCAKQFLLETAVSLWWRITVMV